jgi:hypothetical protein
MERIANINIPLLVLAVQWLPSLSIGFLCVDCVFTAAAAAFSLHI